MSINYDKLLNSSKEFNVDKELLTEIEYNEILLIISKELVKYRDNNNMSQSDLAKKLKVSQVMISKMESGKYNFTIKTLVNLWSDLSTDQINFGEKILKKIYDKIVDNYASNQIECNYHNKVDTKFKYNEKSIEYKEFNTKNSLTITNYDNYIMENVG